MILTYVEVPYGAQSEDEFFKLLSLKPEVIGEGIRFITREFKTQDGTCDILGRRGKDVILIELKVSQSKNIPDKLREQWIDQIHKYVEAFSLLNDIFDIEPTVIPFLVVSVPTDKKGSVLQLQKEKRGSTAKRLGAAQIENELFKDIHKFTKLKREHTEELNRLISEEKDLGIKIASLKRTVSDWNETKRRKALEKEVKEAEKRLESINLNCLVRKRELTKIERQSREVLNTVDKKNVYLSGSGGSVLIGRIEEGTFVWHKPYLEMVNQPRSGQEEDYDGEGF